ncbi:E3 ubiquitin-protein ligase NHLRC1-like [Denticeps clupeoides]|uniref:RING-type E3 ubiquitin transferase n=1 Tax=Denticeps clupeoides TaxID=299321 RepID=A0AAY4A4K0_9TELE|nr:E3 ubiquitin-protein ligase NHLRC1 [Denticeps clupeoides]
MTGTTALSPCLRVEELLGEIHTSLLECRVCFENFSLQRTDRRPQNLPCGHVLCAECIGVLAQPLQQRLECPFCRQSCDVGSTSSCRPLVDLQELMLQLPASVSRCGGAAPGWVKHGLAGEALSLQQAFGGWMKLINPTSLALFGSSGAVAVVHDGEKRASIFSPKGKLLHAFGSKGRAPNNLCHPLGIAVAPGAHLVVTDGGDSSLKVFSSRGSPITIVQDFQLPWGVAVNSCGHILVTDAKAGMLSRVEVDYVHGTVLARKDVLTELQHPRSVACCWVSGNTAVVEHLAGGSIRPTRLRVFNSNFSLLSQVDSFGLGLAYMMSPPSMSSVAFDRAGEVIVADSHRGAIWSLGQAQKTPTVTPLVCAGLIHPTGMVATVENMLVVLDSGDHTVKVYSGRPELKSLVTGRRVEPT